MKYKKKYLDLNTVKYNCIHLLRNLVFQTIRKSQANQRFTTFTYKFAFLMLDHTIYMN